MVKSKGAGRIGIGGHGKERKRRRKEMSELVKGVSLLLQEKSLEE